MIPLSGQLKLIPCYYLDTAHYLVTDAGLKFVVPKADAEVLNKQLPYKTTTRNKQFHDLLVF
jgi:hypothetical protein